MDVKLLEDEEEAILSPYLSSKSRITPFVQPKPVLKTIDIDKSIDIDKLFRISKTLCSESFGKKGNLNSSSKLKKTADKGGKF